MREMSGQDLFIIFWTIYTFVMICIWAEISERLRDK